MTVNTPSVNRTIQKCRTKKFSPKAIAYLSFGLAKERKVNIELINLTGRIITVLVKDQAKAAGNQENIKAAQYNLSAGLYLLKITN